MNYLGWATSYLRREVLAGGSLLGTGQQVAPFFTRHPGFHLAEAYEVVRALCDMRRARGQSRPPQTWLHESYGVGPARDLRRAPRYEGLAARISARFSSTVSSPVMARSTTSSTAPFHFASAAATSAGFCAAMAVSTGFTPMRSKWAA